MMPPTEAAENRHVDVGDGRTHPNVAKKGEGRQWDGATTRALYEQQQEPKIPMLIILD